MIIDIVHTTEETVWKHNLSSRQDLTHFKNIHLQLQSSEIWQIARHFPSHLWSLAEIVKLSIMKCNEVVICKLCNKEVTDRAKHFLLNCENLMDERNEFMEKIVDVLEVRDSVDLFNQDEDILVETLLGGRTDCLLHIEYSVWCQFLLIVASGVSKMKDRLHVSLTE